MSESPWDRMSEPPPEDVSESRPDVPSESRPEPRGEERQARPDAVKRGAIERNADAEIAFHLEMRIRELCAIGYTADAARREALRRFGDVAGTRAVIVRTDFRMERRMERREWWSDVVQDARLAVRQLRRRPGFALVAVLTLAIGIGANTAIFSAADHVLLRPLPYADADRVVRLFETDRRTGEDRKEAPAANFLSWRERSRAFSAMGLAEPYGFDMVTDGRPEPIEAWLVTEGYFEALGVRPMLGRGFVPEEYNQALAESDPSLSAALVVVISHRMWRDRFGGDPGAVGSTIELDGAQRTIVGVLPPSLDYPQPVEVWAPKLFGGGARNGLRRVQTEHSARQRELVVPGIALGALGALGLTRFLRALLYGITPTDPATFAQLAAVMLAVAVAAAFLPAVRAASTDPMRALRQE